MGQYRGEKEEEEEEKKRGKGGERDAHRTTPIERMIRLVCVAPIVGSIYCFDAAASVKVDVAMSMWMDWWISMRLRLRRS